MKRVKIALINYLVRNLLKAVTEEDVLQIAGKEYLYKKRKLTAEEIAMLKEEAASFEKSLLYRLMYSEVRYLAWKLMADKAVNVDDLIAGKMMLYNQSIEKLFVSKVKKL